MADTTTIRIVVPEARSVAEKLLSTRSVQVEGAIKKLDEAHARLDAAWDGPANEAFNTMFTNWRQSLRLIADDLNKVSQYVSVSADKYEQMDQQQQAAVQTLESSTHMAAR